MLRFFSTVACGMLLASSGLVAALPTLKARTATLLSAATLESYAPYVGIAGAAYCDLSQVSSWSCTLCKNTPGFKTSLTGGNGDSVQQYFVGSWPDQEAVVVSHEGTDPTQLLSDLTDVEALLEPLNSTLFPGVSSSVQVHDGFAQEHALTATVILAEVKSLLASTGYTNVYVVGHSLGGALSELEAIYMTLNLPSTVHVKGVTFGTPRVGNPAWAALVDSLVPDYVHIDNEDDPIPIVPGRSLGYQHPHGEIHITSDSNGVAYACSGDDDATDSQCTIASVPNIIESDILDHLGPYDGISLGTIYC